MPTLEFTLDPADLPRLAHWPGLRANRAFPAEITWLDTPEHHLATDGLALTQRRGEYQLSHLRSPIAVQPPAILAKAPRPELLPLPPNVSPQARFQGKQQTLRLIEHGNTSVKLCLLEGRLGLHTLCRLTFDGPATDIQRLALALAEAINLQVPRSSLAEQATASAQSATPIPRALGAPRLPEGRPVTETLAIIIAHLTDVMLHWADQILTARISEPVHQMRVATRRLRSALSLYNPAAPCPELAGLVGPLKLCAARLGHARDWDVFLEGIGARLAETFPNDPRCSALLRAAAHRRRTSYTELRAFLAGPDFRVLTIALAAAAALRPWESAGPQDTLHQDTARFATAVMAKRLRTVRKAGRDLQHLSIPALHELAKNVSASATPPNSPTLSSPPSEPGASSPDSQPSKKNSAN